MGNNSSVCTTTSGTGRCTVVVNNTNVLGTPDVNLQPRIVGDPSQKTSGASHQYVNANAFSLPALGTNGAYRYGFLPGPGYFDSDLTAAKRFRVTEGSSVQFRLAAFNVLNHASTSFTAVNTANYTANISQNSNAATVSQALYSASAASNPQFGYAPLREGRRILELGLRYDF